MSLNLPYVEGTNVKLRQVLKSMRNLLCKSKHRVATEDKNNIFDEIDCKIWEVVYFRESKRSLKSSSFEHKRSAKNYNCEKNEIVVHYWRVNWETGLLDQRNYTFFKEM